MGTNPKGSRLRSGHFLRTLRSNRGFTLVELVVVCAILGVLATMAMSTISDFKDQTKNSRCIEELRGLEKDLIAYATDKGTYPSDAAATWLADIGRSGLKDPWGRDYVYSLTLTRNNAGLQLNYDFDLYSLGSDGLTDLGGSIVPAISQDDIVRAGDGSFMGTAKVHGN